jgi:hypothetical protein
LDVKNRKTVLIGMLVTAVALSALITPANAQPFFHPEGILITTYPQQIVVFGGPGSYAENIAVVIKPPWYFDPETTGFDSVNLTVTLSSTCYQCVQYWAGGSPPVLEGSNNGQLVVQLGAVTMSESNNGALLQVPLTFVVESSTSRGFYMLFLSAQADAADGTIFQGWTQIPVSLVSV